VLAGAEDQRLDCGLRDVERLGDLRVAQALPIAQQDRAAQILRHRGEGVVEAEELLVSVRGAAGQPLLQLLQVGRRLDPRAPRRTQPAREADVVRDLVEPGCLELGNDALLQRPVDAQEGFLDSVLGILARAKLPSAITLDLSAVPFVQPGCIRLGARRP
jgi:hypothetical protein